MTVKFDEFITQIQVKLDDFEREYRRNNLRFPDKFPMEIDVDEDVSDMCYWQHYEDHVISDEDTHVCGETGYIFFSSMKKKMCNICDKVIPWELKPGQAPLISNNRHKSEDIHNK